MQTLRVTIPRQRCLLSFGKRGKLGDFYRRPPPRSAMTRFALLVLLCSLVAGCAPPAVENSQPPLTEVSLAQDDLLAPIDRELDFGYHNRRLNTKDHAAWQIIHGALAYERNFLIEADGKTVPAIEYALAGGQMNGWSLSEGDLLDPETNRHGVRSKLELGSKIGQGHPDQWLGYLQDCDLKLDEKIIIDGKTYTLADWVEQIERDVPRNPNNEFSWTLMTLTKYRPTTHTWTASDGKEWSIDRLLEIELEGGVEGQGIACGGTHRMVGITHAYNRHKAAQEPIEGVWKKAEELITRCQESCRKYQNDDGSFSVNFFRRPGTAIEIGDKLHATGHQFEFLVVSMSDEELKQEWVRRAAVNLTETLRNTHKVPLECGALYHALRGLALYRERLYGEKTYE
jgi:hypothetical protein